MKSPYERYYKLGFEHYINKYILHLKKPNRKTDIFYLLLIAILLLVANLL